MRYKGLILGCCLGMLLLLPLSLIGQSLKTYSGPLQLKKYKGEANYSYSIVDKDTILDGAFKFSRSNLKALLDKEDVSFLIQGQFQNNYPNGNWSFRFNEFQSNDNNEVEDYRYVVNVDGIQKVAFGDIVQGRPNGTWTFKIQQIRDSEVKDVDFSSVIEFENGIPQRSFRIEDDQQELVGRFLRNGLAHDKWTLFSDRELDEIESWNFNEGVLQSIELNSRSSSKRIEVYKNSQTQYKTISLGEKYLEILEFYLPEDNLRSIKESGVRALLSANEAHYQNVDSILSQLGSSSFSPEFKVMVPHYPLNSKEESLMDSIVVYYKKSRTISDFLINDSQLSIRKLSDKDVRSLEEVVEAISEEILNPVGEVSGYYENKIFRYLDRNNLISKLWTNGVPQIEGFEKYDISLKQHITEGDTGLQVIKTLAEQTFYRLDAIQTILKNKIDKQVKQQEAIALEKELISRHNYLKELSTPNPADSIPEMFYNVLSQLKNNAESKLETYSGIKNIEKKLNYGQELVDCFGDFRKVGETVLNIPKQQKTIQEKYMDAVWNPFIATVMDEMVKKRIVSSFDNILVPYFLEQIEVGLACDKTQDWIDTVNTTYQRILVLRDEDTRKMERKLKKEKDPLVILQRFEVPIQTNEEQ
ncbi:hypothetical protein M0D21_12110 [Aquimarina sp. D1M17]|uniref:hypothetical protein n=1 Tax=Aquimarina acroporae TaxID=2937283 RepID=UPI0020C0F497|nr:hypothetical protein [Aquimarina acroporae]MCK8522320.1 hypothetical protein [Aquimarina acroporae]